MGYFFGSIIMESKKTLVVGASLKPNRYSNQAVNRLTQNNHPVFAYGLRNGAIGNVEVSKQWPTDETFDTLTLYLNPQRQEAFYQPILDLNPKRVIFNPGTENQEFQKQLADAGVEVEVACTLVMLSIGNY
ncbi:MAG: CoA-binding protein [Flavobacteriales bacterium]